MYADTMDPSVACVQPRVASVEVAGLPDQATGIPLSVRSYTGVYGCLWALLVGTSTWGVRTAVQQAPHLLGKLGDGPQHGHDIHYLESALL